MEICVISRGQSPPDASGGGHTASTSSVGWKGVKMGIMDEESLEDYGPRMIVARPRAVPIPLPLIAFTPVRLNLCKCKCQSV